MAGIILPFKKAQSMTEQRVIRDYFGPLETQDVRVGGAKCMDPHKACPHPDISLREQVQFEVLTVAELPERKTMFETLRDNEYLAAMFKKLGNKFYVGSTPMGIPVGDRKYVPLSTFMLWLKHEKTLDGSTCEIPLDADLRPARISASDRFNKLGFELRFVSSCYVSELGHSSIPPMRVVVGWNSINAATDPFGPDSELVVYIEKASVIYWLKRLGNTLGFERTVEPF